MAPGAGFAESPEFLKVFAKEQLEPTWWEAKLWQLYDAPAYAENFRNVPLVAYSGEKDKQKQAADLMAGVLSKVGHRPGARDRPGHRPQLPPRRQGRASTGWSTPWPRRAAIRCPAGSRW